MKYLKTVALAVLTFAVAVPTMAQQWQNPVIKKYGRVKLYKDAAIQPDTNTNHKVVFHVAPDKQKDGVDATLWHVARLVNLYAVSDVDKENVDIVAVVSGPATDLVMDNEAYQEKHDTQNPNLPLMKSLHNYGVKIYVCGQATAEHDIDPYSELNKYTTLSLSALIDVPYFQRKGYQLMD